jgi:uncharacterized protein (TIGR03546 family)
MNPLSILKSLITLFQGEDDPRHIAAGFALGASLGLVPKNNLLAVLFFLLFFFFRLEKGMALISALVFTPLGYMLDPVAHRIGYALLTLRPLKPLWTRLYNLPLVPWTKFNNTVVLGNFVLGLLFFFPLYFAGQRAILYYRKRWRNRVDDLGWVKAFKAWRWVKTIIKWSAKVQQ